MNPFEKDLPVLKLDWNSIPAPDMKKTKARISNQSINKESITTAISMYSDELRQKKYNDIIVDKINAVMKQTRSIIDISFKDVKQSMLSLNQETLRVMSKMDERQKMRFEDVTLRYQEIQNTIIDSLTMAKLDMQSTMVSIQESFENGNKELADQFNTQFELIYETIKTTTDELRVHLENINVEFSEIRLEMNKYHRGIMDEWKRQLQVHSDVFDTTMAQINTAIRLLTEMRTEVTTKYAQLQARMDRARVNINLGYPGGYRGGYRGGQQYYNQVIYVDYT